MDRKHELSMLSRLFSASIFREFSKSSRSSLFSRLVIQAGIEPRMPQAATVGDVFDEAFSLLKKNGMRDEYVYRAALVQKIALGKHSLSTATILNEFRAGPCKADLVVLNGTSTAYEIKSERDSLARLQNQLLNYRQVFASVNVVVSQRHCHEVLATTSSDIGVMTLSSRFTLNVEREPNVDPARTSPLMMLDVLRINEAVAILRNLQVEVPNVANTRMRRELQSIFAGINPCIVHEQMVLELKKSRSQTHLTEFAKSLPPSVRAASLSLNPNARGRASIINALKTPLADALSWE